MRVQPERPTAPLLSKVMSRLGSAVAACSTHMSPAPPVPITATSVSMRSRSSGSGCAMDPPRAQAPDRPGGVEALGAGRRPPLHVVATVDAHRPAGAIHAGAPAGV